MNVCSWFFEESLKRNECNDAGDLKGKIGSREREALLYKDGIERSGQNDREAGVMMTDSSHLRLVCCGQATKRVSYRRRVARMSELHQETLSSST
jgi:hypothetical protein